MGPPAAPTALRAASATAQQPAGGFANTGWVIFILLGFVAITVNWTTGALAFQPLSFHVLGAGARAAPFSPWFVTVSFPLGAVIFLWKWLRMSRQPAPPAGTPPELAVP